MLNWIDDDDPLPPTRLALGPGSEAPGLLAAGGSLTPQRLDEAYRRGIFPWFSPGQPVLWWSPDPRMVLPVARFQGVAQPGQDAAPLRAQPRLRAAHRQRLRPCHRGLRATPREGQAGTWIVPQMVAAYRAWHRLRPRAQLRDLGRRPAGRRAVRRGHRPHVLRRIDVRLGQRRVEDRTGGAGGLLPAARHRPDRLPAEHRRISHRWVRTRCRAHTSSSTCPACRGSRTSPIGPMIFACGGSSRRCMAHPC